MRCAIGAADVTTGTSGRRARRRKAGDSKALSLMTSSRAGAGVGVGVAVLELSVVERLQIRDADDVEWGRSV